MKDSIITTPVPVLGIRRNSLTFWPETKSNYY